MEENKRNGSSLIERARKARERFLPYDEQTVRRLAFAAIVMLSWIMVWALVLKLGSEIMLVRNYYNLKDMTLEERILWDIIPFNYRGDDYWKMRQFIDTILNCFVFSPLGVMLCYVFKKPSLALNALVCFGFSLCIEVLQLFTTVGNPATEDLITNLLGCFIGYGIYALIFKRLTEKQNVRCFAVVCVVLGLGVLFSFVTVALAWDTIVGIATGIL